MPGRAFAIVNPAAGNMRTARVWPAVCRELTAAGLELATATTGAAGDATRLARGAVRDGWPLVVAVGGDGTVNEVVNGLVEDGAAPALGIVATGRGRDVCRNLAVPCDPHDAVARIVAGAEAPVDLGLVEWTGGRRWFVNAAGAGFDAEVARRACAGGGSGTIPYLVAVLATLGRHAPVPSVVETDDARWSGRATAIVVANGSCYGGGMKIAPAAVTDDGLLDVVVLGDVGRIELLRWLPAVYRGRHVDNPNVVVRRSRHVVIDAARPLPVHVDGEPVAATPIRVEVRPRALRVLR